MRFYFFYFVRLNINFEMGIRTKLILICLMATFLTGCATKYQAWSKYQGYKETKAEDDRIIVSFTANMHTDVQTVKDYLLYRCAELTLENEFDYFIIFEQQDDTPRDYMTSSGVGYESGQMNSAPTYSYVIKCGKGEKPNEYNAYNAKDVKNNLESEIIRVKKK